MAFLAVYTWAKSLDDKSAAAGVGSTNAFAGHLDDRNPQLDYGRSDFDVNHRFVASMVYQLPFGRGKHFGDGMSKAMDLALGGWQFTTIATFQRGFPFSILCNGNIVVQTSSFNNRCNEIGNSYPSGFHKSITSWFNNAITYTTSPTDPNDGTRSSCVASTSTGVAFCQPLNGQYGNTGRDILRGPGINDWDIGLGKDFKFTERVSFQFRAESFNAFNHHQYGYDPFTATSIGAPIDVNPNDFKLVTPGVSQSTFGNVIAARPGRIIQFGGKIVF